MQRYGLLLVDTARTGPSRPRATVTGANGLLDQLKSVPASAFEAVDVCACMVDPDSALADCPG